MFSPCRSQLRLAKINARQQLVYVQIPCILVKLGRSVCQTKVQVSANHSVSRSVRQSVSHPVNKYVRQLVSNKVSNSVR